MDQHDYVDENDIADDEIEIEAIGVEVDAQPIELYKVLKIANAVSGGGEAKYAISEGYVAVNGEFETRKRRKLYDGDLIEFNQEFYLVICEAPVTEAPAVKTKPEAKKPSSKTKRSNKPKQNKNGHSAKKSNKSQSATAEPKPKKNTGGRSSIDFF
ncbi:RNA-binding S4 domain-containing protein [Vibrio nitrifigilis]|uniref:RNA-binding S4 domain-containing protein n=1 Tax=Vibrio nitrifigilis TaxID=2789781 RepID=A0ABS0GJ71_9VIBR|nr:RNA-binding S4 domain-containing protein [Vibrio nitrifigilis]MBF9002473.1 RNA-binding S4 domain-containing protein [Vibrio nitrifigilis]